MAAPRPNFVVVVTDDMRDSDWQALPKTQALIGDQGTVFPNFFLTTPVCSPSRASILTGMYGHNHGVTRNDGKRRAYDQFRQKDLGRRSISSILRQDGYRTGIFGKFMNGVPEKGGVPGGWNQWLVSTETDYYRFTANENGKTRQFRQKSQYSTDVFRNAASEFIRSTSAELPFLLFFAPKAPHGPSTPARRDRGRFAGASVERSPDFNELDVSDKPGYIRGGSFLAARAMDNLNRKRLETLIAVDEAIEQIVDALSDANRLANTYVFVLSDNGYQLGSHRHVTKGVPYRHSVQVRMAASGPRFAGGGIDNRIAANIDIAPTIAALAGVNVPSADGESLLEPASRDAVLLQRFGGGSPYRAVRSERHLYVEHKNGERELYDYRDDPYELDNLLANWNGHMPSPEAETLAADFAARLAALSTCAGATCS